MTDLTLVNANVLTMDPARPRATAVAVAGGRIAAVDEVPAKALRLVDLRGAFWRVVAAFNINTAGFAIVALFLAVWVAALAYWRFGHVEARWTIPMRDGRLVSETLEE